MVCLVAIETGRLVDRSVELACTAMEEVETRVKSLLPLSLLVVSNDDASLTSSTLLFPMKPAFLREGYEIDVVVVGGGNDDVAMTTKDATGRLTVGGYGLCFG